MLKAQSPTLNRLFGTQISTEEEMKDRLKSKQIKKDPIKTGKDSVENLVGTDLYETFFKHYTKKQWNKYPEELNAEVLARIPLRYNTDDRYFSDKYQALPTHGYTRIFENLLKAETITVRLNSDYFDIKDQIRSDAKVIFCGPIDGYFQSMGLPALEYRSLKFHYEYHDNEGYVQPASVVNFPQPDTLFTRSIEFKQFLHQKSSKSVIVKETSTDQGDPYYPVLNEKNIALYEKYKKLASESNVTFVGRLATFKYYNMDQVIAAALKVADELLGVASKCDIQIVLSYYNEDTKEVYSNIKELRKAVGCVAPVVIYNKGPSKLPKDWENVEEKMLPNVGREGHTYLHHIVNNYNRLSAFTVFSQALTNDLGWAAKSLKEGLNEKTGYLTLSYWSRCDHCLHGDLQWSRNVNQINALFNEGILKEEPTIAYFAQFAASAKRIRKAPLEKYSALLEVLELDSSSEFFNRRVNMQQFGKADEPVSPLFGHSLERGWPVIFNCYGKVLQSNTCSGGNYFKNIQTCQCTDE